MAELFTSGILIDLILIVVVIEALGLSIYWRMRGRGVSPSRLLANLGAGACLLLALRFALAGTGWQWCCASLAAAGLAHIVDLGQRWRA